MRIGFLINPCAGIGGAMAMKGSDGLNTNDLLAQGGQCLSQARAKIALQCLQKPTDIEWITAPAMMGEDLLNTCGFHYQIVGQLPQEKTTAEDTERLATQLVAEGIDLLLFVGGDGTARNIFNALKQTDTLQQLVMGIPAGVKMHSGVYTVSPQAATRVLDILLAQEAVSIAMQEVRDIDEDALRAGKLNSRYYGELKTPNDNRYVQQVKNSGRQDEQEMQAEIAASVVDNMEEDGLYLVGCGTTVQAVMDELDLPNTLLGIDVLLGRELIGSDLTARALEQLLAQYPHHRAVLLLTAIGGQGHIIGRGNQQLSPTVLSRVGKDNVQVLITPDKLAELDNRPLLMDSGDPELDRQWSGWVTLHTGYQQTAVYPLSDGVD